MLPRDAHSTSVLWPGGANAREESATETIVVFGEIIRDQPDILYLDADGAKLG
jgi:hypothetical protein